MNEFPVVEIRLTCEEKESGFVGGAAGEALAESLPLFEFMALLASFRILAIRSSDPSGAKLKPGLTGGLSSRGENEMEPRCKVKRSWKLFVFGHENLKRLPK